MVEIGLTDLPKSGYARAHPTHPGTTGLYDVPKCISNSSQVQFLLGKVQADLTGNTYPWEILGQWDILLLNLTSIGFHDFF